MASHLTTPDPAELQKMLRDMLDSGVEVVGMEVSAHAIDMHRLDGMEYDVGCFTNFSQDHLDYFQTMDRYFETKKSFITGGQVRNATLNADDDAVAAIRNEMTIPNITYGISANSDLYARDIDEITDSDAFRNPKWEDTIAYKVSRAPIGLTDNDWTLYNEMVLGEMTRDWDKYAENYLMHIADDGDLECILSFLRLS